MGCGGDREKGPPEQTQKWAFITLSDFRATSAWERVGYIYLWIMAFVSIAVYAVDTFTAVQLLVFDRWSSQIQPAIAFKYSKWIFAVCILLSWALCIYQWIRAIWVINRDGVAESYMDPLAVTLQSMRPNGGWKRFLVFSELTKSKKGADHVAFFVYFAFNGAIRVILCEAPRQVVNALSLYAVMNADLLTDTSSGTNKFDQFFVNLGALAEKDHEQALILFSMLFTLSIWVFSALSLIAAVVLYLLLLFHYIPQRDGRLSIYCRRKIDRRLERIVQSKINAAIEEEERQTAKAEQKAAMKRQKTDGSLATMASKAGTLPPKSLAAVGRQPTLPQLGESPEINKKDDKLPDFGLSRQDTSTTVATLPRYESRPPTRQGVQRQPTLPDLAAIGSERPQMPSRMATQGSQWSTQSYESDAPLLANAGYAGQAGRESPAPGMMPRQGSNASFASRPPMGSGRQGSMASQQSQQRPFTPMSQNGSMYNRPPPGPRGPPVRSDTGFSFDTEPHSAVSPITPVDAYGRPYGPRRQVTQESFAAAPTPGPGMMHRNNSQASTFTRPLQSELQHPGQGIDRRPTYGSLHSQQSSLSRPFPGGGSLRRPSQQTQETTPASADSIELQPQPSYSSLTQQRTMTPTPEPAGGYTAFNPGMLHAGPSPTPPPPSQMPSSLLPGGPKRNITVTGDPGSSSNYFGNVREAAPQRSATAPIDNRLTTGYGDIISDYSEPSARNTPATSPGLYPSSQGAQGQHHLSVEQDQLPRHVSSVYSQATQFASPVQEQFAPVPLLPRAHTASPAVHQPQYDRVASPWARNEGGARTESWERSPDNRF